MKLFAFLVLLAASAQAQDKSLAAAMAELNSVLHLGSMGAEWNVYRINDQAVCMFSNELNRYYPAAFDHILADPTYQLTRTRMISQEVDWDNFILHELQPALGVHDIIDTCTTLERGGVAQLRAELRSLVDEPLIDSTITRLRQESAAFNDWQLAIEENQAAVHDLRCSSPVQQVFTVMYSAGVDLDFALNIFLRVLFGGAAATEC